MRIDRLKIKLQLTCGDGYAIGPGKAEVLEAIDREGSISAAGRALGMSYRRTWLLADEMNRSFHDKLIDTQKGGKAERGAKLTATGRRVLDAFRALEARAADLTRDPDYNMLVTASRDAPLPPKSSE